MIEVDLPRDEAAPARCRRATRSLAGGHDAVTWNVFRSLRQIGSGVWLPQLFLTAFPLLDPPPSSHAVVSLWRTVSPPVSLLDDETKLVTSRLGEAYDPATVFSSIDHGGRYAYGNQPPIAQWNLARLAEAERLPAPELSRENQVDLALINNAVGKYPQVLNMAREANARLVVLAGDTHNAWASELADADGNAVGVELATSSVSSPGSVPDEPAVEKRSQREASCCRAHSSSVFFSSSGLPAPGIGL